MITTSDIQARLPSSEDYLKLFDRTGVGTVDTAFVAQCIADGESEVNMRLFAALGNSTLDAAGGTVDAAVKRVAVTYAVRCALLLNPLLTDQDTAPYRNAFKWADDFLDRLCKDRQNRVVTSRAGITEPTASVQSYVSAPVPVFSAASVGEEADPGATSVNGSGGRWSGF